MVVAGPATRTGNLEFRKLSLCPIELRPRAGVRHAPRWKEPRLPEPRNEPQNDIKLLVAEAPAQGQKEQRQLRRHQDGFQG